MSREIVIDCSVSGAWVLEDERTEHSERLLSHVLSGELRLVQPELWRYEMLNVLRTAVVRKRMTDRAAKRALLSLRSIPVEIVSAEAQGQAEILTSALELKLSAYDAAYLSLARLRGSDLVSADRGLLRLRPRFPWIRPLRQFCKGLTRSRRRSRNERE